MAHNDTDNLAHVRGCSPPPTGRASLDFPFEWNPYAAQPHNVAPRKERFRYRLRFLDGYLKILRDNAAIAYPAIMKFLALRRQMYRCSVPFSNPFGIAISPLETRQDEAIELLHSTGAKHALLRIPSWEADRMECYESWFARLQERKFEVMIALLQNRQDVIDPAKWRMFLETVFARFAGRCNHFQIGHAWNRTKWGVWDYREYLGLIAAAAPLVRKYGVKLVGPAVIDFEFHLYPPVMNAIQFDVVSSLLYVDRGGAPENRHYGWNTAAKVALLKAIVATCLDKKTPPQSGLQPPEIWVTEVNWPLLGTGKYSPAAGKPNVSEQHQADYLVRYYLWVLAGGYVQRIYWWQLLAPGYGLIDSRGAWRKYPSYYAMKTMIEQLNFSEFTGLTQQNDAYFFSFFKAGTEFVVCWTSGRSFKHAFSRQLRRALNRDGYEIPITDNQVIISGSPLYVFFNA